MNNYIGPKHLKATLKNKERIEKLMNKKSLSTLKKELQEVFNTFIRLRDTQYSNGTAFFVCISCDKPKDLSQMNAGHFHPVGSNESIRYDEDNTHGQCIGCNLHKHGNPREYERNLIKRIGKERFDLLEIKRHNLSKMMSFECEYLIQEYKDKIEQLKAKRK